MIADMMKNKLLHKKNLLQRCPNCDAINTENQFAVYQSTNGFINWSINPTLILKQQDIYALFECDCGASWEKLLQARKS